MRRVIFNQKGGVGKTTITCNMAAMSAFHGNKTLVIDLDPQGNATQYLMGEKTAQLKYSMVDFFEGFLYFTFSAREWESSITKTPFENLDLMPSHPDLSDLMEKLASRYKMFKLKEALDQFEHYDAIYIDTPPAMNFYTRSALIASNSCLIPFDCDEFSRQAIHALLEDVKELKEDHNSSLEIEGIIINQFQSRSKLPRKTVAKLIDEGLPVLEPYLSSSVKVRESHELSKPLAYLDAKHKVTREFKALYDTIYQSRKLPTGHL